MLEQGMMVVLVEVDVMVGLEVIVYTMDRVEAQVGWMITTLFWTDWVSDYYGGASSSGFRDDNRRREEYNPDDYDDTRVSTARSPTSPSATRATSSFSSPPPKPEAKEKEKVVAVDDLLGDWGDDTVATSSSTNQNKALPSVANVLDTSGDGMDDLLSHVWPLHVIL